MAEVVILKQDGSYTHVEMNCNREEARKNLDIVFQNAGLHDNKMVGIKGKDFDIIIDLDKIVEIMVKD